MAQYNLTVPTGSGLDVRVGFNNAIQSLASRFAGATDPASMNPSCAFPYMLWPDTGTGYLKQRTADNTEWVEVGVILEDGTFQFYPQPGTINGDVTIEGKTMLNGALHQPNPATIATVSGVLTLTELSNFFIVTGSEAVTSISGWTSGKVLIRWSAARTITYNATSLILPGASSIIVAAGDVMEFASLGSGNWVCTDYQPVSGYSSGGSPGDIVYTAKSSPPTGFLKANGAAVSRTTYANLYAAIGTTYGTGDGSTTFNLPDLRGEFIRGWDDSRGVDTDRTFGSTQADALQNITGTFSSHTSSNISGAFYLGSSYSGNGQNSQTNYIVNFSASKVARTATETRPTNVALLACIRY